MATSRIEAFSDGVFAIAITLLVLEIHVPEHPRDGLGRALLDQWPSYASYVVSFFVIGPRSGAGEPSALAGAEGSRHGRGQPHAAVRFTAPESGGSSRTDVWVPPWSGHRRDAMLGP